MVDELKAFAEARGHTVAQLALAWVLGNPAVSVALVGARDWRATGKAFGLPIFERDNLVKNVAVVDQLQAFAAERGHTVAQLALAWTLRNPAVSVALVGARKSDEIASALPAATWHLSDDDAATIARIMAGAAGNE